MNDIEFKLFSFKGKMRILHLTWFAFFLSFYVWFNHAPLLVSIRDSLNLSDQQIKVLLILNVALTIPARIVIGMLVDSLGPRRLYSGLLLVSSFLCFGFAMADDFQTLALMRFLLGFVGAGFVIGIRMVSEWFPAKQVGLAEGIYGGWGNFGAAAAAITLPAFALALGGENGWRYAIAFTGVLCLIYGVIYYFSVTNTPKGATYFKPKKSGAMEVTSKGDFILYLLTNIPMLLTLAVLAWKLGPANLGMLSGTVTLLIYALLTGIYLLQAFRIYQVNQHIFKEAVPDIERYQFKQVVVLNLSYLVAFGSELAVISMLPLFFLETFEVSQMAAGLLASAYAFTNVFARPLGGLLSDKYGRKRVLIYHMVGLIGGYFLMAKMNGSWPLILAFLVTMVCSVIVNSATGAIFAVVPLVKRRLTGQVAGMAGAYGNVGAVAYLTILSFVTPELFFMVIAASAVFVLLSVIFIMEEPAATMTEVLPDGTVQIIDVA